jgi:hypothetical protein
MLFLLLNSDVGRSSSVETASQPRRSESSSTLLWEPKIFHDKQIGLSGELVVGARTKGNSIAFVLQDNKDGRTKILRITSFKNAKYFNRRIFLFSYYVQFYNYITRAIIINVKGS